MPKKTILLMVVSASLLLPCAAPADLKSRSPAAVERYAGQTRVLHKAEAVVAFRRLSGHDNPVSDRSGVRFRGKHEASGIVVFEARPSARRALSTDMRARGYFETPCYTTLGGRWVVPTDLIVVQFRPDASNEDIRRFLAGAKVERVSARAGRDRQLIVRASDPARALALAAEWHASRLVQWAQANCVRQAVPRFTPNDTEYPLQWHLRNTGQGGGLFKHDVAAERAWDITRGNSNVLIAVLDDGFPTNHPDLVGNYFVNSAEWPTNGLDDDANGYVDDYRGWDFPASDNNPVPESDDDHGTAVSGLAMAIANNANAVAGLAHRCRLLPVRVYADSLDNDIDWAEAIDYAAGFSNVAVISISYLLDPTPLNMDALRHAQVHGRGGKGTLICVALGNDGVRRRYLEDLAAAPEVLGVGGNSNYDKRSWFADFGPALDLVAAAGGGNRSLVTTDRLGAAGYEPGSFSTNSAEGTSFSCPQVAATAALLASLHPDWTALEIQRQIEMTCDKIDSGVAEYNARGWSEFYGYGRLNAWAALATPALPWDPYEPDNSAGAAVRIEDSEMQYRSLATGADEDWVRFTLARPGDIRLTVVGTTNAALQIYNSAMILVATNDPEAYPYAISTANGLAATTYYARVVSPSASAIPFYGLHFGILNEVDAYESDDNLGSAVPIEPREMQYRTIYPTGDVDWATFTLDREAGVEIYTLGELNGDTALFLRDSGGGLIASDTDTNYWYSYVSNTLPAGVYYVEVQSWTNTVPLASYQLEVQVYGPDALETNDDSTTARPMVTGQRYSGTIHPEGDRDWFTFTISNRACVLLLTDTINPMWLGDTIITLMNESLVGIATNDDGNDLDSNGYGYSALCMSNLAAGTYFVEVSGWGVDVDYYLAFDVFNPESVITNIALGTNGITLSWPGDSVFNYSVAAGRENSWTPVTNLPGRVGANSWTDANPATTRWYRITAP